MKASKTWDSKNEPFPTRLRALMEERDVTQQALADAIGVKRQTIAAYADGGADPTLPKLSAMADYFRISIDNLTGKHACTTLENNEIQTLLGLSDKAISRLKYLSGALEEFGQIDAVNALLETKWGDRLLQIISAYAFADFAHGYRADGDVYEGYEGMEDIPIGKIEFRNGDNSRSIHRVFDVRDMAEALLLEVPSLIRRIRKAQNPLEDSPIDRPRGVSTHVHYRLIDGEKEANPNVNPEDSK